MNKEKEYYGIFEGTTFVIAKDEDEAREKLWKELERYATNFINLEEVRLE